MIDPVTITSVSALAIVYEIGKVWLPVGTFFFGCYKMWSYIKDNFSLIIAKVQENTTATNELRNDFRTIYIPLLTMPKPKATVRARKNK